MRIIAIWDRSRVAPGSRTVYCLLSDGRLISVQPEEIRQGRLSGETGFPVYGDAFKSGDVRYDFRRAHFVLCHIGGKLLWIESLHADTE